MPKLVVNGASLSCNQSVAPAQLVVLPSERADVDTQPMATIHDHLPMVNIPPFGMCNATTNPTVIAATAAASGVPTPAPCVPATSKPWTPGSAIAELHGKPLLTDNSHCMCQWAGDITISDPATDAEVSS